MAQNGIAMDVSPLFDSLLLGKNVEVLEPMLPEGARLHSARHGEFQRLHHAGEVAPRGFAYQQVDVLGHDDLGVNREPVLQARGLQASLEDEPRLRRGEAGLTVVAGSGHKVVVSAAVTAFLSLRHGCKRSILRTHISKSRDVERPRGSLSARFHLYHGLQPLVTNSERLCHGGSIAFDHLFWAARIRIRWAQRRIFHKRRLWMGWQHQRLLRTL